jgi:hypothetical protein
MSLQGSYGASLVTRLLGTWAIVYGALIFIDGTQRWADPVYQIINLVPGSPFSWGTLLIIGGLITMAGSLHRKNFPLPNFRVTYPTIDWIGWNPKLILHSMLVDWSPAQVRNVGLYIIAFWTLVFGLALMITIFAGLSIPLGLGSRDLLISIISVVMTKVKEPGDR